MTIGAPVCIVCAVQPTGATLMTKETKTLARWRMIADITTVVV